MDSDKHIFAKTGNTLRQKFTIQRHHLQRPETRIINIS